MVKKISQDSPLLHTEKTYDAGLSSALSVA